MSDSLKFDEDEVEAMYFYFPCIAKGRYRHCPSPHFYFILWYYDGLIRSLQIFGGHDELEAKYYEVLRVLAKLEQAIIKEISDGKPGSLESLMKNICQVAKHEALKYGFYNYQKEMNWSRVVNAMGRHLLAICYGQLEDPDSGHLHLYHALANVHKLQFMVGGDVGKNDLYIEVSDE